MGQYLEGALRHFAVSGSPLLGQESSAEGRYSDFSTSELCSSVFSDCTSSLEIYPSQSLSPGGHLGGCCVAAPLG